MVLAGTTRGTARGQSTGSEGVETALQTPENPGFARSRDLRGDNGDNGDNGDTALLATSPGAVANDDRGPFVGRLDSTRPVW